MRTTRPILAWILLVAFPLYTISPLAAAAPADWVTDPATRSRQIEQWDRLSKDRQLTAAELIQWSLAEFADGDFRGSLAHARCARGATQKLKEKAAAYVVIAQSLGALGQHDEAGFAALEGQRLDPDSRILAAYRVGFFSKSGNILQKLAADDHLAKLDSDYARHPVCEPVTMVIAALAVIAVTTIICATYLESKMIDKAALSKDPQFHETVRQMAKELAAVFHLAEVLSSFGGAVIR